jgi:hypothetical protein
MVKMWMSLQRRVKSSPQLTWRRAAGPLLPHAVEQTVQGEIAGVKVRGVVDLLDTDGCVQNPNMVNVIASEHRITEYQTAGLVNVLKQQTDKLQ